MRNRKIVVPAVSWSTTVAPAIQFDFEPLICEADPQTFGVDLQYLEDLLKRHEPAAVILVHVLGCPNDMEAILRLKEKYGFYLMEDCCASHGSRFAGQKVGTFGDLSAFSFYYGHHMSMIEGGIVCTNNESFQDLLVQLRGHGWAKDLAPEKEAKLAQEHRPVDFNRMFTFYQPGFNVRSTELNAKIGLLQPAAPGRDDCPAYRQPSPLPGTLAIGAGILFPALRAGGDFEHCLRGFGQFGRASGAHCPGLAEQGH